MTQLDVDRRLLMQGSFGAFAGLAAFGTDANAQTQGDADPEVFAEIDAVLKRTEELFNSQQSIKGLWDEDDPSPYYIAEEVREYRAAIDADDRDKIDQLGTEDPRYHNDRVAPGVVVLSRTVVDPPKVGALIH